MTALPKQLQNTIKERARLFCRHRTAIRHKGFRYKLFDCLHWKIALFKKNCLNCNCSEPHKKPVKRAKTDKNKRTLYWFWTHRVQNLIECSYGADDRSWTCTVAHRNLKPARLPIPPHPQNNKIIIEILMIVKPNHDKFAVQMLLYFNYLWQEINKYKYF